MHEPEWHNHNSFFPRLTPHISHPPNPPRASLSFPTINH